jgi:hypothetical protein
MFGCGIGKKSFYFLYHSGQYPCMLEVQLLHSMDSATCLAPSRSINTARCCCRRIFSSRTTRPNCACTRTSTTSTCAFFSEVSEFVAAVEGDTGNGLFVIDLDALHNMQADMQDSRKTLMLGELLQRLPAGKRIRLPAEQRARAGATCCSRSWSTAIAWPMPKSRSPTMCWSTSCSTCSSSRSAATWCALVHLGDTGNGWTRLACARRASS